MLWEAFISEMERGVNHRQTVITPPQQRRKKRGVRLAVAYALRGLIALLALTLVVLLVCGILYVKEHLVPPTDNGSTETLDTGKDTTNEEAESTSQPQSPTDEYTAVLDAGHGGIQSGCAFDGVLEKDITLAVTLLAAEKLRAEGVTVILTREDDTDVSLEERCRIANDASADLFVSVHCNSYEDSSVCGFEGYYHNGTKGQRLAEYILAAANALGVKTRHVKDENYQVIRDTTMPAALMEIGFLSNPSERAELQSEEYQNTIAQAIANGVLAMRAAG